MESESESDSNEEESDQDESDEDESDQDESDEEESDEDKRSQIGTKKAEKTKTKEKEKGNEDNKNKGRRGKDPSREERSLPQPPKDHCSHSQDKQNQLDPYPKFDQANFEPTGKWKDTDKSLSDIKKQAEEAFEKMKYWRRNLWKTPGGKVGKLIIKEMTFLITNWIKRSQMEEIALTLNMIFLPLMLQKSGPKVRAASLKEIIEARYHKWSKGHIKELVEEAEYIQDRIERMNKNYTEKAVKLFARLMMQGKVKQALRVVAGSQGGVAKASPETLQKLKEKHPSAAPTDPKTLAEGLFKKIPDSAWEKIDADFIRKIALNSKGAAGWSGIDSEDLKHLLCSKNYGTFSENMCEAVAQLTKRLCKDFVDPNSLYAFLACRLIPLEKGEKDVRPIGIGESLRRLVGKAVVKAIKGDIQRACGSLQVCAGVDAGCEAAIHAVREAFEEDDCEGALLIDASNAFNSVKRETTLLNISILCPAFFIFLVNTYRRPIRLFIPTWKQEILSLEGTTQGDPAAMGMYAISVVPIIHKAASGPELVQAWYADDGTGVGKLVKLRSWWNIIEKEGPKYGYYANAKKTILVVKSEKEAKARELFDNTGIIIETEGTRHLGAALGKRSFLEQYVTQKVQKWEKEIETLSTFAVTEPQAAYAAFVFGIKGKWNFLQRTVPHIGHLFQPLENSLSNKFLANLTGHQLSPLEREVMSLPSRNGGLGIYNPTITSENNFEDSKTITKHIADLILKQEWMCPDESKTKEAKAKVVNQKREREKEHLRHLKNQISEPEKKKKDKIKQTPGPKEPTLSKALELAHQKGASSWLTALPLKENNFVLNKEEFRDALALRYGWRPKHLPQKCACGAVNTITHCLDCKLGGYINMRHNETRNVFATFLRKAGCHSVAIEQGLLPVEGELDNIPGAEKGDDSRMDVTAVGFWGAWQRAFFDIRVFDPFAPSYAKKSLTSLMKQNEKEKKRKYGARIREIEKGSFTPLVFTVTGGCGKECDTVMKKLATMIADKTHNTHSSVMSWMRTQISFTLLRSCITCLRGWRRAKQRFETLTDVDTEIVCAQAHI